jgi:beta-glucosidase
MTDHRIETLLDAMTLEEQVALLSGADFWSVAGVERLGIGALVVTDGPNGARGGGGLVGGPKAACFPCGIALGSTWNPALVAEVGAALAEETRTKGADVLLGPTINIHRSVTNGRNFECFSEDPWLTAKLAVAYVQGLQDAGVGATPKHFVGNESEIERTTVSSMIPEVALRETYLAPFEAVTKAGAWAMMSSYNKVNETYSAENHWLLTGVLRDEWHWDGLVMSDWFGSRSMEPTIDAGLDLEMPGPTRDRGAALVAAVREGRVDAAPIRASARRMLHLMQRTGALGRTTRPPEGEADVPAHRALIRRAGAEGTVMLKNDGGLLPLPSTIGKIAVIGPNARSARIMGGGSAQLNAHRAVSPWEGLADRLGEERLVFAEGCTNHRWEPLWTGAQTVDYFASPDLSGAPVHSEPMTDAVQFWVPPIAGGKVDPRTFSARISGSFTPDRTATYRVGIHATGPVRLLVDGKVTAEAWSDWKPGRTFFEEGNDEVTADVALQAGRIYAVTVEFRAKPGANLDFSAFRAGIGLPIGSDAITKAAEIAASADAVILCLGRSGEWDTEGSDLAEIRLPGEQDALAAAVLTANPRTVIVLQSGGPVEMPWIGQAAAVLQSWYPGQEAGHAIADVLFGDAEPGGRLPQTFPARLEDNPTYSQDPEIYPGLDGKVRYEEGLFTGHRHHDRTGIVPLFHFGHGLGYTTFMLDDLSGKVTGEGSEFQVRVTNTGKRKGATVVQLYLGPEPVPEGRPRRQLRAFAKVTLDPGEAETVTLHTDARAFQRWDAGAQDWVPVSGRWHAEVGFSAGDIRATTTLRVPDLSGP